MIKCHMNNTLNFRPLTQHTVPSYTHKWRTYRGRRFCDVKSPYIGYTIVFSSGGASSALSWQRGRERERERERERKRWERPHWIVFPRITTISRRIECTARASSYNNEYLNTRSDRYVLTCLELEDAQSVIGLMVYTSLFVAVRWCGIIVASNHQDDTRSIGLRLAIRTAACWETSMWGSWTDLYKSVFSYLRTPTTQSCPRFHFV